MTGNYEPLFEKNQVNNSQFLSVEFICLEVKATGRQRYLLLKYVDEWFGIVCDGAGFVIKVLKFLFLLAPG
jgi:hypothetical protein